MFSALALVLLATPALAAEPLFDGGRAVSLRELLLAQPAPPVAAQGNVVFVTLDGVRWQEFLSGKPDFVLSRDRGATFPGFWAHMAAQGVVYSDMSISNSAELSMPAYHSIFAGATQPCRDNDCGRVTVETFPERLVREGFAGVATFASWTGIASAVEHVAGATLVDAGEGGRTRLDAVTYPKAFAYLKANKPRFLYISLNDADELAHQGDYAGYLKALRQYDAWLVELAAALDAMGDYGANTTLIVTTDHGRGILWDWRNHGGRPWARRVWAYARHPRLKKKGLNVLGGSHVDLRPTIEAALGLAPLRGSGRGAPLRHALTTHP